jgi:hypothetical protein
MIEKEVRFKNTDLRGEGKWILRNGTILGGRVPFNVNIVPYITIVASRFINLFFFGNDTRL